MAQTPLTSDQVLEMDITKLADILWEGQNLYQVTDNELAALNWIGYRYEITVCLLESYDEETGTLDLDPVEIGIILSAEGLDRVPMLDENTALARIIWAIGPTEI